MCIMAGTVLRITETTESEIFGGRQVRATKGKAAQGGGDTTQCGQSKGTEKFSQMIALFSKKSAGGAGAKHENPAAMGATVRTEKTKAYSAFSAGGGGRLDRTPRQRGNALLLWAVSPVRKSERGGAEHPRRE